MWSFTQQMQELDPNFGARSEGQQIADFLSKLKSTLPANVLKLSQHFAGLIKSTEGNLPLPS